MKFGEQLSTQLTPEWRKKYIDYEALKKILYSRLEKAPSAEMENTEKRERYFARQDEDFFKRCEDELEKINLFFNQKLAESQSKYRDLMAELELARRRQRSATDRKKTDDSSSGGTSSGAVMAPIRWIKRRGTDAGNLLSSATTGAIQLDTITEGDETKDDQSSIPSKTEREIKDGLKEFYLELVLLQNYQQMNITGFRKILKKHDKIWENARGGEWKKCKVDTAPFAVNKEVDTLIEQVENVYSEQLESGNRQKAMKSLRVPPLSEKQSAWTTFSFGLFLGTFIVIFCTIVLSAIYLSGLFTPPWVVVRLYRGFFLIFLNIFLMGLNMYAWQSSGVNHVLVLALAKQEKCEVWGVELNPWLVAYSKLDAWKLNLRQYAKFKRANLWKIDLSQYSGVVVFGTESLMPDLTQKMQRELTNGDFVIACRFPITIWEPYKKFGDGIDTVWLYKMGDKNA